MSVCLFQVPWLKTTLILGEGIGGGKTTKKVHECVVLCYKSVFATIYVQDWRYHIFPVKHPSALFALKLCSQYRQLSNKAVDFKCEDKGQKNNIREEKGTKRLWWKKIYFNTRNSTPLVLAPLSSAPFSLSDAAITVGRGNKIFAQFKVNFRVIIKDWLIDWVKRVWRHI